jgi:TRAP-type C4-dicarboxylate transport system substrate-binding protein
VKVRANCAGVVLMTGLAIAFLAGCAGSSSNKGGGSPEQKPTVLTMADWSFGDSTLQVFLDEVTRLSGGTIRIEPRNNWRKGQVDYASGLIRDVKAGKADLGWAGSGAWDSVGVKSVRALHAPLLIDSYALQEQVVRSPLVTEMLRGLNHIGLVGLGVLPGPMRKPLGVKRPLVTPADYAGLTIGVQQSRVSDATMRALRAKPVWFPAGGDIGGFDGIEQQVASIEGNSYDAIGKFLTANVNLWPRPLVVFMNRKAFESLTADQRKILRRAVTDVIPDEIAMDRHDDRTSAGILCGRGSRFMTANPNDLAALRRAVQPVYDALERDPQTRAFIAKIEAMRRKLRASPDAPRCAAPTSTAAAGAPTLLDGVWRVTTTPKDLRAAGAPEGEVIPDNYGALVFVVDRDRFAFTQENHQACVWGYGRLKVWDHKMRLLFINGGETAGTGAANRQGELFVFGWSLYREVLTLTPVPGAVSPTPVRAKPWGRVSTTQSRRYFSERCPPPAVALRQ